jgi:hypothetical protein
MSQVVLSPLTFVCKTDCPVAENISIEDSISDDVMLSVVLAGLGNTLKSVIS